jgi:hypothetical protein
MFARFFSLITTIFTSLILFPPHDGALQALLWGPKLLASALSPQLALLGGLFGVVGIRRKDWLVSAVGLFGATVAAKHAAQTNAYYMERFLALMNGIEINL